jgi:hypothetical protein
MVISGYLLKLEPLGFADRMVVRSPKNEENSKIGTQAVNYS